MKLEILKKKITKKKIFITGNTGFVGSWLSIILSFFGAKVLGFSLKKKEKKFISNNVKFKKKIKTIYADINLINKYKNRIKKFKPEIVIHLASQPLVLESYEDTRKTFSTNVMGTVNLLETLKEVKSIKKIIIFTSDKVYRNLNGKVLNENSSLGGIDPYSASKSCQDIISTTYKASIYKKKIEMIILRAGNIIGGGDWNKYRIIPDIFKSLHANKRIYIRNPNAIRPWQHIFEILNFFILAIIQKSRVTNNPEIFNIAPSLKSNIKVINLIKLIKKIGNYKGFKFIIKKNSKYESSILRLSSLNAKRRINYKPKLDLKKSLKLTIDWYKNYYNKKDIYSYSLKQLKNYFSK
tara:strand:+ start:52 stop:1107 length:1056 start_codon:yes stop_codon:yes gene_type:complete